MSTVEGDPAGTVEGDPAGTVEGDPAGTVEVELLGRFAVTIDGSEVDPTLWRGRPAAALVKLLALSADRRLHREQVIDALWPQATLDEATPRLHKAVHHARRALDGTAAISTAGNSVQLFPGRDVRIDVVDFERAATAALDHDDGAARERALRTYRGELLPDDRYEDWAQPRREHLGHVYRQLLRAAGRWSELVALEPADEDAHVALMRAHLERGDRAGAVAQFDRLAASLRVQLGVDPGREAVALRDRALTVDAASTATLPPQQVRFCHAPDGLRLAYAITGGGPPLVKAANWLTHLEHDWESALWRHWLGALSERFALLRYDVRGSGLSDWNTTTFALESWVEDLATVVDAAGYERFPLLGVSQGAAVAVEYAVRNPERVQALVLYGGYVHGPIMRARSDEERRAAELTQQLAELGWGTAEPSFRQVFTSRFLPSGSREQWDELNELQRRTTSPANAAHFLRGVAGIDISAVATQVRCPTLVLHVRGDRMPPVREGQLLAGLIPGSRFVSLDGDNHLVQEDEPAWPRLLAEIDDFLAGLGLVGAS